MGQAALSFLIPSISKGSTRSRRPAYLSSATQSIVVNIFNADGTSPNPPIAPVVTNVGSSSCTTVTSGVQCTVTVRVPTRALLFAVAAYAAPNGGGALLSSSMTAATIGTGSNSVAVTLSPQTQYVGTNLSGGGMQTVTIDHEAATFQVAANGTNQSNGTFATLPNGDLKFTITAASDGTTIRSIAYVREMANGAMMYIATDATAPNADGSATNADFGMLTAVQPCPTTNTTWPVDVVDIAGPNFPASVSSREAYATGTATITRASLAFSGTSYLLAGTSLGATSSQPAACANGVFTSSTSDQVAYDPQGFVVVSSGPSSGDPTMSSQNGNFGFRAPSQPFTLSAIASQTYEMYSASFAPGTTNRSEVPYAVTPDGSNALSACPYVNFETNSASSTSCTTITLSAQPFPGIVTGTATSGGSTTPFVAAVGQINGKYVMVVLSATSSEAVNAALMQQ